MNCMNHPAKHIFRVKHGIGRGYMGAKRRNEFILANCTIFDG